MSRTTQSKARPRIRRGVVLFGMAFALACRDDTPLTPPSPVIVGSVVNVVVTAPRQVLVPGDSVQLSAQAFDAQGRVLPTATVTWSSGNPAAATIDSRGMVTAVGLGNTTISATTGGQSGTTEIVVSIAQLCDCTRIVDSTATELVQRNDTTGVYVFRVLGGQQPAIDSGSIIVGAEDGGFLRRVTGAARSGDLVTVQTTVAYVEEAVQVGAFAATTATDGEDVPGAVDAGATRFGPWTTTYMAPGVTMSGAGLCCSLDGLVISLKTDEGLNLPLTYSGEFTVKDGDIDFLPRLELSANFSAFQLQSFRAAVRGGLGLNLDVYEFKLTASATTDKLALKKESKIFLVQQKPFATFIGPMPLAGLITKVLKLQITPTISSSVVFSGRFRTGFGITGGMQWARQGGWSPVFSASSYFDATAPQLQGIEGTASVKIAVVPEFSIQFYGVAGPKIDLEPYAEAAATAGLSYDIVGDSATGLDWETKISLGVNVNIGAKISLLGRKDIAEASFAIPIIKPWKLVRGFSDGPLTVYTEVTGEDKPDSLSVQLRPAFIDTLPPLGRDLSTSTRDLTIASNDSMDLDDIRSGTSYRHRLSLVDLPGNCTFGPPRADDLTTAQYVQPVDTVVIRSNAFIGLGRSPAVDTLRVDCIPLGGLRIRTVTTGKNPTERSNLRLELTDKNVAGKGKPPLTMTIPGGPTPPDTVIGGLIPANANNGSTGQYVATLDPGRRNCAVAKPTSHQAFITSGDTTLTEFRITCVALGHTRGRSRTFDPDAAAPSDPVVYTLEIVERDAAGASTQSTSPAAASTALGASATALVSDLIPLYNASGATGRHVVNVKNAPNRCTEAGQYTRPVTVFPGDTAIADFTMNCVERLHVATRSTGPSADRDGFVVIVENADGSADSASIGADETIGIAGVIPGDHTIRLGDVDANCTTPASVRRTVSGRDSTLVTFTVNCPGPAAPRGLRATRVESSRIDLAWDPAPTGGPAAYYRLYRSIVGNPASAVVVDSIPDLDHNDVGLSSFTAYSYQVAAVDADGLAGPRSTALVVRTRDGTPPSAPFGLTAVPVSGLAIQLAWGAAIDNESGITRYRIYRGGVLIDSTVTTSYLNSGLTPTTTYSYQVLAVNGEGVGGPLSNTATATTLDATPPSAPTGLAATVQGSTRIDLAWIAAADAESGVASYKVYRDGVLAGTATGTTYSDLGLTPSTTYTYEVSAVNGAGLEGPRSSPAVATTAAPPVTTGTLTVIVQSRGSNIPVAGYMVQVSAAGVQLDQPIAPDGNVVFGALIAQSYTVLLHGIPANCASVDGLNPRTVSVAAGSTVSTSFIVSCR